MLATSPRQHRLPVCVRRGSSVFYNGCSWRHREHDVLSFFAICVRYAQQQFVLVNAKLCCLPDRKSPKRWVSPIYRHSGWTAYPGLERTLVL